MMAILAFNKLSRTINFIHLELLHSQFLTCDLIYSTLLVGEIYGLFHLRVPKTALKNTLLEAKDLIK